MKWRLGLLVLGMSASLAAAQQPDKVSAALRQPVTLDFANLTLDQCAERLRSASRLNMIIHESLRPLLEAREQRLVEGPPPLAPEGTADPASADPAGQVQQPRGFSCTLRHMPLGTALRTFLDHYGLGYAVVGESIVIATADKARQLAHSRPVSLHFENVPVAQALAELSSRYRIDVILDRHALPDTKAPVTVRAREVSRKMRSICWPIAWTCTRPR
ncbi:MAG: hypothetical protein L0Y71_22385 [Gemmataceae bacterium]|nr:hypothetical protein [Gemmataceae bacterium]